MIKDEIFTLSEKMNLSGLAWLNSALSRKGKASRLSILIYHRVLARSDPILDTEPDAGEFERQMSILAGYFNVLPLTEAVSRLRQGNLQAGSACVTFDDGYADNAEIALPILQRLGIPATFFIATGFLNGGCMWNDRVIESVRGAEGESLDLTSVGLGSYSLNTNLERKQAIAQILPALKYLTPQARDERVFQITEIASVPIPDNFMMTHDQVRSLSNAGMEIGGHTVNHPILTSIDKETAADEIAHGREELMTITGAPVKVFAYPNGIPVTDYANQHIDIVRSQGFEAAVSTSYGVAGMSTDPYQLPRFTPWDKQPERFMLRLMQNRLMYKSAMV